MTKPVSAFVHPNSLIFSNARGNAASLDAELNASSQGCTIALKNPEMGILDISMIGTRVKTRNRINDAYTQPISFPKFVKTLIPFTPIVAANEAPIPIGASIIYVECLSIMNLPYGCSPYSSLLNQQI